MWFVGKHHSDTLSALGSMVAGIHNQFKKTRPFGAVLVPVSARFPMAPLSRLRPTSERLVRNSSFWLLDSVTDFSKSRAAYGGEERKRVISSLAFARTTPVLPCQSTTMRTNLAPAQRRERKDLRRENQWWGSEREDWCFAGPPTTR